MAEAKCKEGECGARCVNPGAPLTHTAKGKFVQIAGVEAYRIGDHKTKAVLYITDIFGHKFVNAHKIADAIASEGITVVAPNLFHAGAPFDAKNPDWANFGPWLEKNTVAASIKVAEATLAALVAEGFTSIQTIGYCYGCAIVTHLISTSTHVKGAVMSHPSFIQRGDGAKVRKGVNLLMNIAERDDYFTPALDADYSAGVKAAGVHVWRVSYPNTDHGFASRPNLDDEHSHKIFNFALETTARFLAFHA